MQGAGCLSGANKLGKALTSGRAWLFTCCSYWVAVYSILSHINSVKDVKAMLFLGDRFPPTGHFIIFTKMLSSFSSTASLYQIIHAWVLPTLPGCFQCSLSPPPLLAPAVSLWLSSLAWGFPLSPEGLALEYSYINPGHTPALHLKVSKIRGCRDDKTLKCLHTDTHPIAGSHDSLRVNHSLFILYQGQYYKK